MCENRGPQLKNPGVPHTLYYLVQVPVGDAGLVTVATSPWDAKAGLTTVLADPWDVERWPWSAVPLPGKFNAKGRRSLN